MACNQCGNMSADKFDCPNCRQVSPVKVLSEDERDGFTGETIDAPVLNGHRQHNGGSYYQHTGPRYGYTTQNQRVYKFNLLPSSFIGKALAVLIAGILIFVALPIFFLVVLLSAIAWFLLSKRK